MKYIKYIALLPLIFCATPNWAAQMNDTKLTQTQVIEFKPTLTLKPTKTGYCWTESLKTSRPDAWRCMIGNEIQDPCFGTTQENIVVCGVNPEKNDLGFALRLTKPLPKLAKAVAQQNINSKAWFIKLIDGTTCSPFTGTLPQVNGEPILYSCSDPKLCMNQKNCNLLAGVINVDDHVQPWMAIKVIYSPDTDETNPDHIQVKRLMTLPVATAWE